MGGVTPGRRLLRINSQRYRQAGLTPHRVGRGQHVPLCQQVGVDVVVGDGAVLVGARDAVDVETPLGIVMPERTPQSGCLDEQLDADLALERLVAGRRLIPDHGVGDVAVDVESRRAGRPVARAFLSADRSPRKDGAGEAKLSRALAREVERGVAPAQRVCRRVRSCVCEHGQDETLGVPERVAVVPGASKSLGGNRALLRAGSCLKRMEEPEAHGQLKLGVAVELDACAFPEFVEVGALPFDEPVPAGVARLGQRRRDLVAKRRMRAPPRPRVGEELHDLEALPGSKIGRDRDTRDVISALTGGVCARGPCDEVIHPRCQPQLAGARRVREDRPNVMVEERLGDQRRFECSRGARIGRARRCGLVRHETRLRNHAQRLFERFDLVEDRSRGTLRK